MSTVPTEHLQALGSAKQYDFNGPHRQFLERFANPFLISSQALPEGCKASQSVLVIAPEFTSLCPMTGQPDFATIELEYTPNQWCVESKSFKLYLGSFRNVGEFHESCVARIGNDLVHLLQPHKLTVRGKFTPRGGIAFWPTFKYATAASFDL